ncbi:MAG: enoyl-CoA hydratase/isomerase family protein [Hyphomicrobiales bacterium]|nr:enoyl-CoA hydratase/isomerase family protein [Hyphomicrobiales bacterium]
MSDEILVKQDGAILRVTINRPEHGNAATDPMALELTDTLAGAADRARLVVLRGAGKDFCVGRASMGAQPSGDPEAIERKRQSDVIFNTYNAFRNSRIPIIAVVTGRAHGFGCAIAGVADITVAAESATFSIPEMAHRILPTMVMSALMDRVPRKELTYLVYSTAVISAARARECGLVSEIVADDKLDAFVEDLCKTILNAPNPATEGAKEFLRRAFTMDVPSAIDYARNIHALVNAAKEMRK